MCLTQEKHFLTLSLRFLLQDVHEDLVVRELRLKFPVLGVNHLLQHIQVLSSCQNRSKYFLGGGYEQRFQIDLLLLFAMTRSIVILCMLF